MFNIEFKGNYKDDESQLIKDKKLPDGANIFKEPNTAMVAFLQGLIFAIPVVFLMIVILFFVSKNLNLDIKYNNNRFLICCLISFIFLYIHEIIHAICFPIKDKKEIWMYTSQLSLFVYSEAKVSKIRFIVINIMPAFLLGILPFIFSMIFAKFLGETLLLDFVTVCIINVLLAVGDYTNIFNTIRQVPKNAKVFNHGFHSYWIEK